MNHFFKSITAGVCISIGCIVYLSVDNKIIGALLFAVGLLAIITYGFNLYTGKIGLVKNIDDINQCVMYFFGNYIGCALTRLVIILTPIDKKIEEPLSKLIDSKMSMHYYELFILGIFCGILMLFATKYKQNTILTILCVAVFILCGFEHSVADSFYLAAEPGCILRILTIALGNAVGAITINKIIEIGE